MRIGNPHKPLLLKKNLFYNKSTMHGGIKEDLLVFLAIIITVVSLSSFVKEVNEYLETSGVAEVSSGPAVTALSREVPEDSYDIYAQFDINKDDKIVLYYPAPRYAYADYEIFSECWDAKVSSNASCSVADFDGDGAVNLSDVEAMQEAIRFDKNKDSVIVLR
jgi:hypothetical protein